jgi:hypothetical protein
VQKASKKEEIKDAGATRFPNAGAVQMKRQ